MIGILSVVTAAMLLIVPNQAIAADGLSAAEAANLMIKVRDTCKVYVSNAEQFWKRQYREAADAPGVILLNRE